MPGFHHSQGIRYVGSCRLGSINHTTPEPLDTGGRTGSGVRLCGLPIFKLQLRDQPSQDAFCTTKAFVASLKPCLLTPKCPFSGAPLVVPLYTLVCICAPLASECWFGDVWGLRLVRLPYDEPQNLTLNPN